MIFPANLNWAWSKHKESSATDLRSKNAKHAREYDELSNVKNIIG